MLEQVCPIMPSRDFDVTEGFYRSLGFEVFRYGGEYLIANRDKVELHFFAAPDHQAETCDHGAYIRPLDVDALSAEWAAKNMAGPDTSDYPRFRAAEDKPWGMRELHVLDPDGNLLRVGQEIR
ncbi:MAG: VOC family protein [Pseudomonadota bacterium]